MQQARLSVASLGTPEPAYPSRRSLREAAVVPEVLPAVDEAPAAPAVVPPAPGSRRAAREARIAAAAALVPGVAEAAVAPASVVPASVAPVVSSADPIAVPA